VVVLFAHLTHALSQRKELSDEFDMFVKQYHKTYQNEEEKALRYEIFRANYETIVTHNANKKNWYTVGLNKFADLDISEIVREDAVTTPPVRQAMKVNTIGKAPVADAMDWRALNMVGDVDNHDIKCSSSWYISSVDQISSACSIVNKGKYVQLSKDQVVQCVNQNLKCQPGGPEAVFTYATRNGLQANFSYQVTRDGSCNYNMSATFCHIESGHQISTGNEVDLKTAVYQSPVTVGIDGSQKTFQFYSGGIYYNPQCRTNKATHHLLVVGYNTSDSGVNYWIAQNSWGTDWGLNGYIYLAKDAKNNCGVASHAVYATGVHID